MHRVGNAEGDIYRRTLRERLEEVFHELADAGAIDSQGERDVRIRLTPEGRVRWFECVRRKPGSELEQS
jgi:hypothetical protein